MSPSPSVILRPYTPADRAEYEALYEVSFPAAERKPLDSMLIDERLTDERLTDERLTHERIVGEHAEAYNILVAETSDRAVAGMVITVTRGDLVMLDYLAIHPDMRGRGLGHKVLSLIKERCSDKHFFLEIEAPTEHCDNPTERTRRKAFYRSAGMVETHIHAFIYGTEMELLSYPEDVPHITFDGYADLVAAYFPPEMRVMPIQS